jgi:hypothetical protein
VENVFRRLRLSKTAPEPQAAWRVVLEASSLQAMQGITARVRRELRSIPGVRGSHIGRAEVADEVLGPNFTELWISLDPSVEYEPTAI